MYVLLPDAMTFDCGILNLETFGHYKLNARQIQTHAAVVTGFYGMVNHLAVHVVNERLLSHSQTA